MTNAFATPGQVRRTVHLLFAIQLASMAAMEMSGPFWPVHLKSLAASELLFGFAGIAVYVGPMLGIMLTSGFWGRIGDRFGHRLMMVRALLGLSLTQLALAWAQDVWTILALRFLQGACAGYLAPAQAYGVSVESPDRRTRLFAHLQVSTNIGALAGAVAGGLILDHAAFFWINIAASVVCALCATAVILLPSPPASTVAPLSAARATAGPADAVRRSSPLLDLLIIIGVLLASRMISQVPYSLYVGAFFEVGHGAAGLCYGLLALGFVVSASAWARSFESLALPEALRRMLYVAASCAVLTAIAGITRSFGVFAAVYFAWGLVLGATTPVLTSLIARQAGGRPGQVLGVTQSVLQFSAISGIAFGACFTQVAGLQYTYFLVALSYGLGTLAIWMVRRRLPIGRSDHTSPGRQTT